MASKLKRKKSRNNYQLNFLEGKRFIFTQGKWAGQEVCLDKRNKKGVWDISTHFSSIKTLANGDMIIGWHYDRITEEQLIKFADNKLKAEIRNYNLNKIC